MAAAAVVVCCYLFVRCLLIVCSSRMLFVFEQPNTNRQQIDKSQTSKQTKSMSCSELSKNNNAYNNDNDANNDNYNNNDNSNDNTSQH